jgi:SNF2 family DNA or RNA helicase
MMNLYDLSEKDAEELADSFPILSRGRAYFREGRVISLTLKKNLLAAQVRGNKIYHVKINITGNEIDAECSCPYSYGCKHIVATLLKWAKTKNSGRFKISTIASQNKKKTPLAESLVFGDCIFLAETKALVHSFDLLRDDNVEIIKNDKNIIVGKIKDGNKQHKAILYSAEESVLKECSCKSYFAASNCEHVIALMLKVLKERGENAIPKGYESKIRQELYKESYDELLSSLSGASFRPKGSEKRRFSLFFSIYPKEEGINLKIEKANVLKNNQLGALSIANFSFLKNNYSSFSESEKKICNLFFSNLNDYSFSFNSSKASKEDFQTPIDMEILLQLRSLFQEHPDKIINCAFPNEKALIEFSFEESSSKSILGEKEYLFKVLTRFNNQVIDISQTENILLGEDSLWLYFKESNQQRTNEKGKIVEIDTENPQLIRKLVSLSNTKLTSEMTSKLIESSYGIFSNIGNVNLPDKHKVEDISAIEPIPLIFLRDFGDSFSIQLRFRYGKKEVSWNSRYDLIIREPEGKMYRIKRKNITEQKHLGHLLENASQEADYFIPSVEPEKWLCEVSSHLISEGFEIYGQDSLVNFKINREAPKLRLEIKSGIDWFDLELDASFGKEQIPFEVLYEALKNNERFIKLSDGSLGLIPQKWLLKLGGIIGFLPKNQKKNGLKLSTAHLPAIEGIIALSKDVKTDERFEEIKKKFQKFKEIKKIPLPQSLKANLRPYQRAGYDWLHFLKEFSFGGCLADDMGLGKTIQVLSLLLYEKEHGNKMPSLIVVPTSLVFNWIEEIKKFAPSLSAYTHHGQERAKTNKEFLQQNQDIVITSYGTLIKDKKLFAEKEFHYLILDESQKIKNPLSESAKNACLLKGKYKLVLTGTPVENNYLELWSQFKFLNPILLGDMDYFKEEFMCTVGKLKQEERASALKMLVNPFILMRKKETVAKDLPQKQITLLYNEMSKEQREFYDAWKEKYKAEITKSIDERGMANSRYKILEGLLRLRQACNHPRLVTENFIGDSNKLNLLIKNIEEITSEGHKILVFSSFVKMLELVKEEFSKKRIKFSYLDGSTRDRQSVVKEFQEESSIPVFLISLKAGGFGLNLTSADYVFLIDPWWNPAVEMQAMDRAHRIGQDKKVFVYKMITKDSIEEKILQLQEKKMDLVKKVIVSEEGIFKNLTREDIDKLFA